MSDSTQSDGAITLEAVKQLRFPEDQSPRATLSRRDYEQATTLASVPPAPIGNEWAPRISTSASPHTSGSTPAKAELPLVRLLGTGGTGCVFLAEQSSLGREVAVKLLRPELSKPEHVANLLAEARTAGALEHPNVVPVHLLASDDQGRPALVMKRVEGVAWSELIHDAQHAFWAKLPAFADKTEAHVGILIQVCNALQFAHSRGVVHRDIKPDNVMVGAFGEVYVMDWGLALSMTASPDPQSRAHSRGPVGTPYYMAPELVLGRPADERTDIFLLGAVLHEVLTQTPRHEGKTILQLLYSAATPKPVVYAQNVPEDLGALANHATAADPDARIASVAEFRGALVAHLSHRGSSVLTRAGWSIYQRLVESSVDAVTFERLAAECRFAFTQALNEWPENPEARRGLKELLTTMLRRALARADLETASALLAALPDRDPELDAAVLAAQEAVQARDHADARAQRIASDMDLSVGARGRQWFFGAIAGVAVVWNIGFFVAWHLGYIVFTHRSILSVGILLMVLISAGTVIARRAVFRNSINRRVALLPVIGMGAVLINRVAGVLRGIEVHTIVADDLLLLAIVSGIAGLFLRRAYFMTASAFFAGAVVAMIWPQWTQQSFTIFVALGLLSVFVLWLRPPRSDEETERSANRL